MFKARLISLSDGQTYQNVQICEEVDFEKYDIPKIFEEFTDCIFVDNKRIIIHNWKIRLIHLDDHKHTGCCPLHAERIILDGELSYFQICIINEMNWDKFGIPRFFGRSGNTSDQMVFSNNDGTFLTHDMSCVSLITQDVRCVRSGHIAQSSALRKSSSVETIHGRINHDYDSSQ